MRVRAMTAGLAVLLLAACAGGPQPEAPQRANLGAGLQPGAAPVIDAQCFATETLAIPDGRGQPGAPEPAHFRIPCPDQMDADRIRSLQRALAARGLYSGAVSGRMSPDTSAAVRRYQASLGLDSGTLSLAGARSLGLIPAEFAETARLAVASATEAAGDAAEVTRKALEAELAAARASAESTAEEPTESPETDAP